MTDLEKENQELKKNLEQMTKERDMLADKIFDVAEPMIAELKAKLAIAREALALARTQFEGLKMGFQAHGNNINVLFHIEYCLDNELSLEQALTQLDLKPHAVLHGTANIQEEDGLASINIRRECDGPEATLIVWEKE